MANYDVFGKFYDAIMGDRGKATMRLRELIHKVNPKAQNVLELGCGTGGARPKRLPIPFPKAKSTSPGMDGC